MQYPIIADIIIVLVVLLFAVGKSKKGFFQSAMGVTILILAIAIGIVGANILTPKITEKLWPQIQEKVEQKIESEAGSVVSGLLESTQGLDGFWQLIVQNLEKVGIDIESIKNDPEGGQKLELATQSTEYMSKLKDNIMLQAEVIVGKIISVILGILIMIVAHFILKKIRKLVGNSVTKIPVLGWFDRFLGFFLGIAEAFVLMYFVIRFCNLIHVDFFARYAEGTTLLKWFVSGNLEESIALLKGIDLSEFSLKSLDLDQIIKSITGGNA